VDTDDGARLGSGAPDMPGESALPPVDVSGVVGPLVVDIGALGEPGSSARYTKIDTMPKRQAIPSPFCKCRILTTYVSSLGRSRVVRSRSDIS
jgi:hypothetical protein